MIDRSNAAFTPDPDERARLVATLGAELRAMRTERGLSTRSLAMRSTVSRNTILRLESGIRRPRPATLNALAYGLDHQDPDPLAERLMQAAGPSLRPDTEAGLKARRRRLRRAHRAVNRLRGEVATEAVHARERVYALFMNDLAGIDIPPMKSSPTMAELRREAAALDAANAVLDASRAAGRRSDALFAALRLDRHPLETGHLRDAQGV